MKNCSNKEHNAEIIMILEFYHAAFKLFTKCNKETLLKKKDKSLLENLIKQIEKTFPEDVNMMPLLLWLKRELIEKML